MTVVSPGYVLKQGFVTRASLSVTTAIYAGSKLLSMTNLNLELEKRQKAKQLSCRQTKSTKSVALFLRFKLSGLSLNWCQICTNNSPSQGRSSTIFALIKNSFAFRSQTPLRTLKEESQTALISANQIIGSKTVFWLRKTLLEKQLTNRTHWVSRSSNES